MRSEKSAKTALPVTTEGISAFDNTPVYVGPSSSDIDNPHANKEDPPACDDSTVSQTGSGKAFPDMITGTASSLYRAAQARGHAKLKMFQSAGTFRDAP